MEVAFKWLEVDKSIEVEVASYNEQAISFYEKYGFDKNGKTVDNGGIPTVF